MGSAPQLQHLGETHEAESSKHNEFPGPGSPSSFRSKDDPTSDIASVNSHKSSRHKHRGGPNVALSMASASASGVGGVVKHYTKGILIDMPLAFAEGSRALPKLYGEEVRDYGTVKDWKSGFTKSGKTLTLGIGEGFADLVVKPYKGVKEKGAVGGITGVGKGVLSFATTVSSGKSKRSAFSCLWTHSRSLLSVKVILSSPSSDHGYGSIPKSGYLQKYPLDIQG